MRHSLRRLSLPELRALAADEAPPASAARAEPGAWPPAFVATRSLAQIADGGSIDWCSTYVIERDHDRRVVGACGFKGEPEAGRVEIGYGVAAACRNVGVAGEAVAMLLAIALRQGAREVLAEVNPANLASTRVVRRAGFAEGGTRVDQEGETVVQWVYLLRDSAA
jgi:RimJ/RimL family protein N-acetyltransferase